MSDAEIITTSISAAMFFNGNHTKACEYMKDHKLVTKMLEKSRFNRRLHNISMLVNDLFHQVGMILKESNNSIEYFIETVFSSITYVFPKSIHAVTYEGFLLKLEAFIE